MPPRNRPTRPTLEQLFNLVDRAEHHGGLTAAEAHRLRVGLHNLARRRTTTDTDLAADLAELRRKYHNARMVAWRAKQRPPDDPGSQEARAAVRRATELARRWQYIPAKRRAAASLLQALHPGKDTDA